MEVKEGSMMVFVSPNTRNPKPALLVTGTEDEQFVTLEMSEGQVIQLVAAGQAFLARRADATKRTNHEVARQERDWYASRLNSHGTTDLG